MSSLQTAPRHFTDGGVQINRANGTVPAMPNTRDIDLIEGLCDRFMAAWEATGLTKQEFARSVGLSASQVTNISRYRNPPPHRAILDAAQTYGLTTDFFYTGNLGGMRDQDMAAKLRDILAQRAAV